MEQDDDDLPPVLIDTKIEVDDVQDDADEVESAPKVPLTIVTGMFRYQIGVVWSRVLTYGMGRVPGSRQDDTLELHPDS